MYESIIPIKTKMIHVFERSSLDDPTGPPEEGEGVFYPML
jgi:hypothetical protein